jgi:hypothetical protein
MAEKSERSWWSRHWKWAVPAGGVSLMLIFGGCIAGVFALVFGAIKSSTPYTDSWISVRAHPTVQQKLGQPIEPGFLVTGNINVSGRAGHADLSYAVSGSNGSGTVYLVADKTAGEWEFTTLHLTLDKNGERIDLLAEE